MEDREAILAIKIRRVPDGGEGQRGDQCRLDLVRLGGAKRPDGLGSDRLPVPDEFGQTEGISFSHAGKLSSHRIHPPGVFRGEDPLNPSSTFAYIGNGTHRKRQPPAFEPVIRSHADLPGSADNGIDPRRGFSLRGQEAGDRAVEAGLQDRWERRTPDERRRNDGGVESTTNLLGERFQFGEAGGLFFGEGFEGVPEKAEFRSILGVDRVVEFFFKRGFLGLVGREPGGDPG